MKYLLILAALAMSCGAERQNLRTQANKQWIVVGQTNISIKSLVGFNVTENTSVTYTSAETNNFAINLANIVAVESGDSNTLDLGSMDVSALKVNKLEQCGVGLDEQCTSAIIRVYTTDVTGHAGVAGFVNTTYGYGTPFLAGETTASQTVGITVANAAILDTYAIPANDKKLTISDFSGVVYEMEVDFSNAGAGDYEMNITIELALGL